MCDAALCMPCTWAPLRWAVPTKGRYNKCWTFTFIFIWWSSWVVTADCFVSTSMHCCCRCLYNTFCFTNVSMFSRKPLTTNFRIDFFYRSYVCQRYLIFCLQSCTSSSSCSMPLQERRRFHDITPQITVISSVPGRPQCWCLRSFSMVRSHVWRGRPQGRFYLHVYDPHRGQNEWRGRRTSDAWAWPSGWQEVEQIAGRLPGWWHGQWKGLVQQMD